MESKLQSRLEEANSAFQEWRNVSFDERKLYFKRLSQLLKERAEEYGTIITTEMHKPIAQSIAEVNKCAKMVDFYVESENILATEVVDSKYDFSEIRYVPKGVILGVMPWNFPFWQVLRFATPAILAGNTVVLKHATICFGSGEAIEQLFLDAGFPKGVFQNLKIGHSEVEEVLQHQAVQGVSLTGSEGAGSKVASIAGKYLKKSLLELGGSDAFIVLEDANLKKAAEVGALARLQNCGQTCVAAKRFIVHKESKTEFLNLLISEFEKYQPADPFDSKTIFSAMAREDLADELENQYNKAIEHGAKVLIPLRRISSNAFMPGLLLVKEGNPILKEELFGPVGMVLIANDDKHALELANDIPFGLSNSVWTNSTDKQEYFIHNLESGTVNINKMTSSEPKFPFGGTKASGYGTELSIYALKEFVTFKTVMGYK